MILTTSNSNDVVADSAMLQAFMRRRETQEREPRGGILADEMGLGKTIMMLANIVNGLPKGKTTKSTLIVASPALVNQWDQEIRRHVQSRRENKHHGIGTVIQYRAGHKIQTNDPLGMFENADIVLTTYYEVSKSYPKAVVPPNLVTAAQKDAWYVLLAPNFSEGVVCADKVQVDRFLRGEQGRTPLG